ncbi:MAG: hypothetical protein WCD76_05330 [Pyrinomonadaceae bacterium]
MKRILFNLACVCFILAASSSHVHAQQQQPTKAPTPTGEAAGRASEGSNADDDFDLNITERRITESRFEAATEIRSGEETARGLNLRVGVLARADEIDLLLRNVRGHVRFRATLEPLLRLLRRGEPPATVAPQSNPSPP